VQRQLDEQRRDQHDKLKEQSIRHEERSTTIEGKNSQQLAQLRTENEQLRKQLNSA
jgi:hypothetical protein